MFEECFLQELRSWCWPRFPKQGMSGLGCAGCGFLFGHFVWRRIRDHKTGSCAASLMRQSRPSPCLLLVHRADTGLWLVNRSHVTPILGSDWLAGAGLRNDALPRTHRGVNISSLWSLNTQIFVTMLPMISTRIWQGQSGPPDVLNMDPGAHSLFIPDHLSRQDTVSCSDPPTERGLRVELLELDKNEWRWIGRGSLPPLFFLWKSSLSTEFVLETWAASCSREKQRERGLRSIHAIIRRKNVETTK